MVPPGLAQMVGVQCVLLNPRVLSSILAIHKKRLVLYGFITQGVLSSSNHLIS